MKTLWVGLVIALLVGVSVPAAAHIAEVATSVSMPAPASEDLGVSHASLGQQGVSACQR